MVRVDCAVDSRTLFNSGLRAALPVRQAVLVAVMVRLLCVKISMRWRGASSGDGQYVHADAGIGRTNLKVKV
jgi:hypothetical protein